MPFACYTEGCWGSEATRPRSCQGEGGRSGRPGVAPSPPPHAVSCPERQRQKTKNIGLLVSLIIEETSHHSGCSSTHKSWKKEPFIPGRQVLLSEPSPELHWKHLLHCSPPDSHSGHVGFKIHFSISCISTTLSRSEHFLRVSLKAETRFICLTNKHASCFNNEIVQVSMVVYLLVCG